MVDAVVPVAEGDRVLAGVRCLFGEGDVMESQSVSPLSRFRTLLRSLGGSALAVPVFEHVVAHGLGLHGVRAQELLTGALGVGAASQ